VIETVSVTWRGRDGRIEWGYFDAAVLPEWEFTGNAERGTITGRASSLDTYRVSQRPLVFAVTRPKGVWRWQVVTLQIHGPTVSVTVGPCEE